MINRPASPVPLPKCQAGTDARRCHAKSEKCTSPRCKAGTDASQSHAKLRKWKCLDGTYASQCHAKLENCQVPDSMLALNTGYCRPGVSERVNRQFLAFPPHPFPQLSWKSQIHCMPAHSAQCTLAPPATLGHHQTSCQLVLELLGYLGEESNLTWLLGR